MRRRVPPTNLRARSRWWPAAVTAGLAVVAATRGQVAPAPPPPDGQQSPNRDPPVRRPDPGPDVRSDVPNGLPAGVAPNARVAVDPPVPTAADVRRPPDRLGAAVPQRYAELADGDPAVREAARSALMGMSPLDLPALQQAVRDAGRPAPAQAAALREIVTHVYLTGDDYRLADPEFRVGFLGVMPQTVQVATEVDGAPAGRAAGPDRPADGPPAVEQATGVLISERHPGFCGARSLRDGDIVLGVLDRRTADRDSFMIVVKGYPAGRTLQFQLLRQGRVIRVPITLDDRPEAAEDLTGTAMRPFLARRRARAAQYWDESFAPLMQPDGG